ncbi:type 1 fimbrial protein [Pseudomonas sp. REP124]|uniref:type 1 fimbrial protein n=1 Tax=Pseudomonas sp. REP124 TaxID=2875731 RepID=UPI001CCC8099|nr:type 1 fimbrial protein [Pseudomonas sp. REP124]MBZ9780565.1 type 1 fimbrial protein [Pseudomonas sp. REP124]
MKINSLPVVLSLLAILPLATTAVAQNSIRFEGSIVERPCHSSLTTAGTLELNTCPALARATAFDAINIDQASSMTSVKLLADSGPDRYYDQRYALVDAKGKPIRAGNYLVTMTLP